jgi:hypothetical protein
MSYQIPHPHNWECCELADRKRELPKQPGVYAVMNSRGNIFYIGRAVNLRKRWSSGHHRYPQAEEVRGAQLAYLTLPESQINAIEAALIRQYSPPWNNSAVPADDDSAYLFWSFLKILALILFLALAGRNHEGKTPVMQTVTPQEQSRDATVMFTVNIRATPSTADDSNIVEQALPGDILTLTGKQEINQYAVWAEVVSTTGDRAWVAAKAVK